MFFPGILFQAIVARGKMLDAAAAGQNQVPGFVMRGNGAGIALQSLLRQLAQKGGNVGPKFFQPSARARGSFEGNCFHGDTYYESGSVSNTARPKKGQRLMFPWILPPGKADSNIPTQRGTPILRRKRPANRRQKAARLPPGKPAPGEATRRYQCLPSHEYRGQV